MVTWRCSKVEEFNQDGFSVYFRPESDDKEVIVSGNIMIQASGTQADTLELQSYIVRRSYPSLPIST